MITGDHAVTAGAIAADLGLGPGVITGKQMAALSDDDLAEALPGLHVFGRVSPQDKLRLVTVMQERGDIVAMTGDAVNDAAALKKADVGVAMGSGAEVTKQAANIILTDNNFGTLVTAIELGRDVYSKITSQIRYVLVGLFGVLGLMLMASLFNINSGNALTAVQLIFVTFLIGIFPALAISTDSVEPGTMQRPPRDPSITILNRSTLPRWLVFGLSQAAVGLVAFTLADRSGWGAQVGQTMTFAVMGVSTVLLAAVLRRDLLPAWFGPYVAFFGWLVVPLVLTWLAVDWDGFQPLVGTVALTGEQWGTVVLLAVLPSALVELEKGWRRRRVVR
jgi:Ca2+-transporting ATPase